MIRTPQELLELLDEDGDTSQSRMVRLVLAHMIGDALLAASVFTEINGDARGADVAMQEQILALTAGLSISWADRGGREHMIGFLRQQLAGLIAEEAV